MRNSNGIDPFAPADSINKDVISSRLIPLEDLSLKGTGKRDDVNHPLKVGDNIRGEDLEGQEISGNIVRIKRDDDGTDLEIYINNNGNVEKIRLSSIHKVNENIGNKSASNVYNLKVIKDFKTFTNENTNKS